MVSSEGREAKNPTKRFGIGRKVVEVVAGRGHAGGAQYKAATEAAPFDPRRAAGRTTPNVAGLRSNYFTHDGLRVGFLALAPARVNGSRRLCASAVRLLHMRRSFTI